MLQYLINTTAIWLISLVLFDVFLRRESYHNYNRFYLLFTFFLGALLPLLQWQDGSKVYVPALQKPIHQVIAAKERIVMVSAGSAAVIHWQQWLTVGYLAGVLVALCLLFADIIKLVSFYRIGARSNQNGWAILETGREHAPFSFLNTLFINSRQQYNDEEWNMILVHERRHSNLLHFADLLLMQFARIVFWFHPLIYIYNKRLLLVHEYQADNASAQKPQVYGKFLVEQALLQSAPNISHSFNRSPIKKRIVMLTRRSSRTAKSKMLVFIPLTLVCIFCFSKNSYSGKFDNRGSTVTYRGNTFEYSKGARYDSIELLYKVTGEPSGSVERHTAIPEKMNGNRIYRMAELTTPPQPYPENGSIPDHLFRQLSKDLNKLPDGTYQLDINNIVIDQNGKIVFYEGIGLTSRDVITTDEQDMKASIDKRTDEILHDAPALRPGKVNNNNVVIMSDLFFMKYEIVVKDHKTAINQVWK